MQTETGHSKKILILTHEFPPFRGGVGTYVQEIALAAHDLGHRITVIAPSYGKDLSAQDAKDYPFQVKRFKGGMYKAKDFPMLLWRTWRLDADEYDLIHAADWSSLMALSFMHRFKKMPFIATTYGTDILAMAHSIQPKVLRIKHKFVAPDKVLAISHFTRKLLLETFPEVDDNKVKVTYLAANPYWFQSVSPAAARRVRETYNISLDRRMILTVARLDERKGHRLVLKALKRLPAPLQSELTYVIVGEGLDQAYVNELHRLATDCRVNVIFTGSIPNDDVRALYSTASVFFMPGEPHPEKVEGFGLVYLEAAAQGVPSVASCMAAIPEVVKDGETGILIPPGDVAALKDVLQRLLKDQDLAKQMGKEAHSWAKSFSWERCARESYGE